MQEFIIDVQSSTIPFPHYWEECVGSGHAALALRNDWQQQMRRCREELGFKSVRFHGLLNNDMSTRAGSKDNPYSFHNIDLIYDFLLSIGMRPFVELSFMPDQLASGAETVFHYKGNITPPKDYKQWSNLIENLAAHLVDRYGIDEVSQWNFEVWNEPNLDCFWTGTMEEYFRLYSSTATALKSVDTRLRVGGPSTAANAWIPEFMEYCRSNSVPFDFVSTHHYPTDAALGHFLDMEASMSQVPRGTVTKMAREVRAQAGSMPLYYTEWNNSPSCRDSYHDDPYGAAFVVKSLFDNHGIVDIYSYWTFSDIFEEVYFSSTPFHGGFGLLNIHGIPKPTYHAFRLMHLLGNERLAVETGVGSSTVECAAVKKGNGLGILVYNHDIPLSAIKTEKTLIRIKGLEEGRMAKMCRIDDDHLNPKKEWIKFGSKEYLTGEEIRKLMERSTMSFSPVYIEKIEGECVIELELPPQGIAGIFID